MDHNLINSTTSMNNTSRHNKKIIKRYGNRKLYDTERSSYVVLGDIAKMIRNREEVQVIDNETKDDITSDTLTQIIFGAEKNSSQSAPLNILKSIIRTGDGSFSSYLADKGVFFRSHIQDEKISIEDDSEVTSNMYGDKKILNKKLQQRQSLPERVVNAALTPDSLPGNEKPILPTSRGNKMRK